MVKNFSLHRNLITAVIFAAIVFSPVPAVNASSQYQNLISELSKAFEISSDEVSASVVSIIAEKRVEVQSPIQEFFGEDFFRRFFEQPEQRDRMIRSMGSGVIMREDGYILTNSHVVAQAEELSVILPNNKEYKAEIIGIDSPSDVAVIKINDNGLTPAQLGDSDDINVGQWVIAVGNPFQLMHTVTAGIISAKGRSDVGIADYEDFIQTDASINPGNSGGALADLSGKVIGINTAIASPSGGNIGIGFAIPINMARQIMQDLIEQGKVIRGYLGIWMQNVTDRLSRALGLEANRGALISDIENGGPADQAGLKRGDVIISFKGEEIESSTELQHLVAETKPGTSVNIEFYRKGEKMEKNVTLGERESEQPPQKQKPEDTGTAKLGLTVQNLSARLAERLGYEEESGVLIVQVSRGSEAAQAGLRQGDLIKQVNQEPVADVQQLKTKIQNIPEGEIAALLIKRGDSTFYTTVEIPD